MRKYLTIAGLLIVGSIVFSSMTGLAQSFRSSDNLVVGKSETVDSALFAGGRNIDIAGTINGDLFCAGMNVSISGKVKGDVFCAAQSLRVSGEIEGSVKLAGQTVNFSSPKVAKAGVVGQTVTIDSATEVTQDAQLAGQDLTVNGDVGRDLAVAGQNVVIANKVGRDVTGSVEKLTLSSGAEVGGDLDYTSTTEAVIQDGAVVSGSVNRQQPKEKQSTNFAVFKPVSILYLFFAMIIVSLVLVVAFPRLFNETNGRIMSLPGKTALIGFAGVFFTPILAILLMITVVGIPLAILILLAWMVVLFVSGPAFAYSVGARVWKRSESPMIIMLVGSVLLILLYIIPIIGFFAVVAAGLLGTGALLSEMFGLDRPAQKVTATATKSAKSKKSK